MCLVRFADEDLGYFARTGSRPMSQTKLVRDKIPEIIRTTGVEPRVWIAEPDEYQSLLRAKLREEVDELLGANDPANVAEEFADVLEVLFTLAAEFGIDRDQLEKHRRAKASERGGFVRRIVWAGNEPR
jgi:predicted house-cleaning noncanonical NTP pyrophosphatase (MazG superfamily)